MINISIKEYHDRLVHKIVEKTNPYVGGLRRKLGGIDFDFTVISNNCWAGSVYRWLNLPYMTPTAGLYFFAEDYVKFLSNLRYYCSIEVQELDLKDSNYKDIIEKKGQQNVPLGKLDDIEIVFLHYPTFAEAKEKWERRCKRICWENLIVKNAEMNGCTPEQIKTFDKLPYDRKFIFTTRDYGIESQIIFKEYMGKEQVKDDTTRFNKYVDIVKLLKDIPFKKQ